MNLETKITIYKFTPQLFTLTRGSSFSALLNYMRIPTKKLLTRYEGMLDERKFTVRMPDGSEKTVLYKGKKINVKF